MKRVREKISLSFKESKREDISFILRGKKIRYLLHLKRVSDKISLSFKEITREDIPFSKESKREDIAYI